ncbi:MAG TPA: hypothetical protein VFV94_08095 [Polyangiaceae bacterium]|nr:hypothetical protein [Polyangiaceae bacterium]
MLGGTTELDGADIGGTEAKAGGRDGFTAGGQALKVWRATAAGKALEAPTGTGATERGPAAGAGGSVLGVA